LKLMPDYPKMHILFSGNAYKGEEWREGKLKKEINESGFSDRIHYLGFQKNISKIYRTIDVLVSTSNGRETFSLVVAEAMSCSKPVISYNIGGPSELIKDEETGYLVRPGNIDDLFLKMSYIINNTQLVNALGQNGANRISSIFNVKRFIDSFDQLYERINNGRYE
ncbi:glycosyltransferase family 4 protein, partial [Oenococcus oeni]